MNKEAKLKSVEIIRKVFKFKKIRVEKIRIKKIFSN